MIWTVSLAASSFTSAHTTFAPSRANRTAAAFPLPQPGPIDPAPTTSATLFCKRPAIGFYETVTLSHYSGQGWQRRLFPGRQDQRTRQHDAPVRCSLEH